MGMIDGPNVYVYVGNNPVNHIDAWGFCKEDNKTSFWEEMYESYQAIARALEYQRWLAHKARAEFYEGDYYNAHEREAWE